MRGTRAMMMMLLGVAAMRAGAQEVARLPAAPDSRLWIEGSSNVNTWSCRATRIDASVDVDSAAVAQDESPASMLRRVEVRVPVRALRCARDAMNRDLYRALKADENPELGYILATFRALPEEGDTAVVHAAGTLRVAGRENRVDLDVTARRLPDGSLLATGAVPIRMTDFGVEPPTAFFGWIRARDEVTVRFALHVRAGELAVVAGR